MNEYQITPPQLGRILAYLERKGWRRAQSTLEMEFMQFYRDELTVYLCLGEGWTWGTYFQAFSTTKPSSVYEDITDQDILGDTLGQLILAIQNISNRPTE
jgi:hypothetical protein